MSDRKRNSDEAPVAARRRGVSRRRFMETASTVGLGAAALLAVPNSLRAQSSGPLKIGVMAPFTGPAARTGDGFRKGATMALEDARERGEVPIELDGVERDVEIVWVDSESSPEAAVKAYTDAVTRQGCEIMTLGWHSSVAMACMDVSARLNIVHIGSNGESQYISEKMLADPEKYKNWFKGWPAPPIFAGLYGEPLRHFEEQGLWMPTSRKAAVVVEDTDFGRGWGEALVASMKEAGFEPLPYDVVQIDQTEFTPLLIKYKAQGVGIVGLTTTGSVSASNFVKQFRSQKVPALLLGHGLTWFSEWASLTGDASDYVITMDSPRVIAPYQREWVERFREKFNVEPSPAPAGHSYDYFTFTIKALNQAGTLDNATLIETAEKMTNQGIWHFYDFAEKPGPRALAQHEVMVGGFEEGFFFPMVQLVKGEAKIVWPLEHAEKEFEAPPWV